MASSGISSVSAPLALAAGAAGVGVGSAVNRLNSDIAMVRTHARTHGLHVQRGLRSFVAAVCAGGGGGGGVPVYVIKDAAVGLCTPTLALIMSSWRVCVCVRAQVAAVRQIREAMLEAHERFGARCAAPSAARAPPWGSRGSRETGRVGWGGRVCGLRSEFGTRRLRWRRVGRTGTGACMACRAQTQPCKPAPRPGPGRCRVDGRSEARSKEMVAAVPLLDRRLSCLLPLSMRRCAALIWRSALDTSAVRRFG
jgi:hypothetical protein